MRKNVTSFPLITDPVEAQRRMNYTSGINLHRYRTGYSYDITSTACVNGYEKIFINIYIIFIKLLYLNKYEKLSGVDGKPKHSKHVDCPIP